MEIALEKKDPKRKLERRRKREERKRSRCLEQAKADTCRPFEKKETTDCEVDGAARPGKTVSRYIAPEKEERVLERAGYQCQHHGPDGARCSNRTGLEIEHTRPFAVYKSHDERYLSALCRTHNLLAAKNFYRAEFIQNKIEAARARCTGRTAPT